MKKSFKSFFGSIFPFPEIVLDFGLNPSCLFHTRENTEENCILCLGSDIAQSQVNLSSEMLCLTRPWLELQSGIFVA